MHTRGFVGAAWSLFCDPHPSLGQDRETPFLIFDEIFTTMYKVRYAGSVVGI